MPWATTELWSPAEEWSGEGETNECGGLKEVSPQNTSTGRGSLRSWPVEFRCPGREICFGHRYPPDVGEFDSFESFEGVGLQI